MLGWCASMGLSLGSIVDATVVDVGDSDIGLLGEILGRIGCVEIRLGATCVEGPALGLPTADDVFVVSRLCCCHCMGDL